MSETIRHNTQFRDKTTEDAYSAWFHEMSTEEGWTEEEAAKALPYFTKLMEDYNFPFIRMKIVKDPGFDGDTGRASYTTNWQNWDTLNMTVHPSLHLDDYAQSGYNMTDPDTLNVYHDQLLEDFMAEFAHQVEYNPLGMTDEETLEYRNNVLTPRRKEKVAAIQNYADVNNMTYKEARDKLEYGFYNTITPSVLLDETPTFQYGYVNPVLEDVTQDTVAVSSGAGDIASKKTSQQWWPKFYGYVDRNDVTLENLLDDHFDWTLLKDSQEDDKPGTIHQDSPLTDQYAQEFLVHNIIEPLLWSHIDRYLDFTDLESKYQTKHLGHSKHKQPWHNH